MNLKEKKEIAVGLSILMDSIIDKDSDSGEIANKAICFASDLLKMFPDIKDIVESFYEDDWDKNIEWIRFEMEHLKTE